MARSDAEQCNKRLEEALSKLQRLDPNEAYQGIVFHLYKNENTTTSIGCLKVFPKYLHLLLANSTNYFLRLPGSLKSSGEEHQGPRWETFWETDNKEKVVQVLRVSFTVQQALRGYFRRISSVRVETIDTKQRWLNGDDDCDKELLLFCSHLHAIHYDASCASQHSNLIVNP